MGRATSIALGLNLRGPEVLGLTSGTFLGLTLSPLRYALKSGEGRSCLATLPPGQRRLWESSFPPGRALLRTECSGLSKWLHFL